MSGLPVAAGSAAELPVAGRQAELAALRRRVDEVAERGSAVLVPKLGISSRAHLVHALHERAGATDPG